MRAFDDKEVLRDDEVDPVADIEAMPCLYCAVPLSELWILVILAVHQEYSHYSVGLSSGTPQGTWIADQGTEYTASA